MRSVFTVGHKTSENEYRTHAFDMPDTAERPACITPTTTCTVFGFAAGWGRGNITGLPSPHGAYAFTSGCCHVRRTRTTTTVAR